MNIESQYDNNEKTLNWNLFDLNSELFALCNIIAAYTQFFLILGKFILLCLTIANRYNGIWGIYAV